MKLERPTEKNKSMMHFVLIIEHDPAPKTSLWRPRVHNNCKREVKNDPLPHECTVAKLGSQNTGQLSVELQLSQLRFWNNLRFVSKVCFVFSFHMHALPMPLVGVFVVSIAITISITGHSKQQRASQ